jgi:hypothetical protein
MRVPVKVWVFNRVNKPTVTEFVGVFALRFFVLPP